MTFDEWIRDRDEYLKEYSSAVDRTKREWELAKSKEEDAYRVYWTVFDEKSKKLYEKRHARTVELYQAYNDARSRYYEEKTKYRQRAFGTNC